MTETNFFIKNENREANLLLYHNNKLVEISKILYEILKDNSYFMDYLLITNYPGIVESFTSDNIKVNYEEIIKYIKDNVKNKEDIKKFFLQLIKQSDLTSGNNMLNDYQFRKEFDYLFK